MTTDKKLPLYIYLILIVVTALQITLFSYRYFNQKKMYYADEYFTYGLANSATQPFLYGSKLYTFDNYDVTLTGDEFRNYISTNEDTAFNYKTCWNNQVSDTLPPLYQLIVHTISSFNAGSFSWGWAFYINLTAFVIAQFFLFRWIYTKIKSGWYALLICGFWGFTIGCQNAVMMARMYIVYLMFSLAFLYFSDQFFTKKDKVSIGALAGIIVSVTLGALTHHLFLVFAFFYTLIRCLVLLYKKQIKTMFTYGFSVLGGVLLSIAIFPATISHLFGSNQVEWGIEPDIYMGTYSIWRILLGETTGINFGVYPGIVEILLQFIVVFGVLIFAAFLWLNRKKEKEGRIIAKIKSVFLRVTGEDGGSSLIAFITVVVYFLFVATQFNYYKCAENSNKYVFNAMPVVIGCIAVGVFLLIKFYKDKKFMYITVASLLCLSVLLQNLTPINKHLIYSESDYNSNGQIRDYVASGDVLLMLDSSVYLPCFCEELADTDQVYVTLYIEDHFKAAEGMDEFFAGDGNKYLVIFNADQESSDSVFNYLSEKYELKANMLTGEGINYMLAMLYELKKEA